MHSQTNRLTSLLHGAARRALSPPERFHATPCRPPVPPRTPRAIGPRSPSAGNANLPIGVELLSTINFRRLTAFLSHSCTLLETSPLCFHILTNSFFRSPFSLITIQIARGVSPPLRKTGVGCICSPPQKLSKHVTRNPPHSNPLSHWRARGCTLTAETGKRSVRVRAVLAARPDKMVIRILHSGGNICAERC